MALKISELSVGDWVYHDDILFGREIAKVERLNENENGETIGIKVYRSDGAFGVVGYIWTSPTQGDLHPIPITAEILEKNGFVKSDDFLHKIDLPDNILLGVRRQTDGYIFELKREKRRIGELLVIIRGIRYIHQFQHALRLAGIDKEINL